MTAAGEQTPTAPAASESGPAGSVTPGAGAPGSAAAGSASAESGTSASGSPRIDAIPPEALIIVGALSVQIGAGLAATLLRQYGPLPVVTLRIVFGALLLMIFQPIRLRAVGRGAFATAILLGLILAAMNSTFYVALSRIPLGVAVTIEFWGPLAVAVLGSRRALDFVWIALAGTGIYILTGARFSADDAVGIVAVLIAGGCWGAYIITGRRMAAYWPDGRGLTLAMAVASVAVIPVALLFSDFTPLATAPLAIFGGLVVALTSSAIPYTLEIAALRRLPAHTFGVLMSLEPAIAAAVGFIVLGQVLHVTDLAAIGCVICASAGASVSARRLPTTPGELESA